MVGFTESFNVSVSAAVVLHEITQRRRQYLGAQGDLPLEQCKERVATWLPKAIRRSVQKLISKGVDVTDEAIRSGTNNAVPWKSSCKPNHRSFCDFVTRMDFLISIIKGDGLL